MPYNSSLIEYTHPSMDPSIRISTLQASCPDVDGRIVQDFVHRMDPDYFQQFEETIISDHLRLAAKLQPEHPSAAHIQKEQGNTYQLTLVAYDYFSEFATICGMLSAYGLDIREAFIYTYTDYRPGSSRNRPPTPLRSSHAPSRLSRHTHLPGLSRKKVVDVFYLRVLQGFAFGPEEQRRFIEDLSEMILLLDTQHIRDARDQVNRRLVETLGKLRAKAPDFIQPVHITFHNDLSLRETVMDIQSTDSPAFLYAFANALAMRGIYISKAKIEVVKSRVRNRFYVRGRHGHKIQGSAEQQELITAAALIKEFTHFLSWAPDPAKALEHFDQLLDALLEEHQTVSELSVLTQKPLLAHLARLFGTSDFLWEDFLRRQHANLLPLMEDFQKEPLVRSHNDLAKALRSHLGKSKETDRRKACLNQFKDQELFRIDMTHMLESTSLPDFSKALTNLAEVILQQALVEAQHVVDRSYKPPVLANGQPIPFGICGLGKLGGWELGYASDIEVLFIYGTNEKKKGLKGTAPSEYFERLVQEFLRWIEAKQEGIFHIDTRLRPYGDQGVLANALEEIQTYYHPQGPAASFERQALIKLRAVAGDKKLGRMVETHRDGFVYSDVPWDLPTALHLRERQMKELVSYGATHVKYSPGGLLDVEYTVQYLQLMHGHRFSTLRTSNTLHALGELEKLGVISKEEAHILREDYLFLRQLIDALRIVRGNAQDLVLPTPGSEGMIFFARRLGFITEDWQEGAVQLEQEIPRRMNRVHQIFTRHFSKARP